MYVMESTTERIANKVRGVAAENRLTQQDVADALRLSRTSVVERMQGRIPFTGSELLELAGAMRVDVRRFFPEMSPVSGVPNPGTGESPSEVSA